MLVAAFRVPIELFLRLDSTSSRGVGRVAEGGRGGGGGPYSKPRGTIGNVQDKTRLQINM